MDRIKESFDSLPIAACFFDKNGVVRLINRRMLAIANWLRKGGIQSLAELHDALRSPPPTVRCLDPQLYIFRRYHILQTCINLYEAEESYSALSIYNHGSHGLY